MATIVQEGLPFGIDSDKKQRTVRAKVESIGLHNDKPLVQIRVDGWPGIHPLPLYGVKPDIVQNLTTGEKYTLILSAGNLKADKTGDAPWDWFWNVEGFGDDRAIEASWDGSTPAPSAPIAPVPAPAPEVAPVPAAISAASAALSGPETRAIAGPGVSINGNGNGHVYAPRERSIQRQVAIKAAVDLIVADSIEGLPDGWQSKMLPLADAIFAWIAEEPRAIPNGNGKAAAPDPPPAPAVTAPEVVSEVATDPEPEVDEVDETAPYDDPNAAMDDADRERQAAWDALA